MVVARCAVVHARHQLYRIFTEFLIAPSLLAELLGGANGEDGSATGDLGGVKWMGKMDG